ncbi:MAG: hypothetical protein M5U28_26715 [Sandaracinaceae bacterium]|nr:hypothetical protein [Sandaracinaceae bacterium]
MSEPRRLLDDPSTGEALRAALDAGRELPDEAQLASLAARLGPLLGPGAEEEPRPRREEARRR